jgi:hypothetical protein
MSDPMFFLLVLCGLCCFALGIGTAEVVNGYTGQDVRYRNVRCQQEVVSMPTLQLTPQHRRLLEVTGWLPYVEAYLDVIVYYPVAQFVTTAGQPAIGAADIQNGMRVAIIATLGHSDIGIASVIVHEATHHAGYTQHGIYADEATCERHQAQFVQAAQQLLWGRAS